MCLKSIKTQTHGDWVCYITNDLSTDSSLAIAEHYAKEDKRFIVIDNQYKMYQPGNYYNVVHRPEIDDEDIIVTLDGDDWFSDNQVLSRLLHYYSNKKIWMAFGQFVVWNGGDRFSHGWTGLPDHNWSNIRNVRFTSTHLRTSKAFLFRKVLKSDLIGPTGNFWEMTGDQACYFPQLEMAGKDRVYYANDINMIYNCDNPLNDHKVSNQTQVNYEHLIRNKTPYQRIQ